MEAWAQNVHICNMQRCGMSFLVGGCKAISPVWDFGKEELGQCTKVGGSLTTGDEAYREGEKGKSE